MSRNRTVRLDLKSQGETGIVKGYGSVFGVKDSYGDIVDKGAFARSIAEQKNSPAMLWQHRDSEPIGVWTQLAEDDHGLVLQGQLALATQRGKDAYELIKMGAINGLSIGYIPKVTEKDEETQTCTIKDLDLWEISLVTFPANEEARVTSLKNTNINQVTDIRSAERVLREAGLSKSTAQGLIARIKASVESEREARVTDSAVINAATRLIQTMEKG